MRTLRNLCAVFWAAVAAIAAPASAQGEPLWWSELDPIAGVGVIDPSGTSSPYSPANVGQTKWMASRCLAALDKGTPHLANEIRHSLVGSKTVEATLQIPHNPDSAWFEQQRAPLALGQLKALAQPFYDTLNFGIGAATVKEHLTLSGLDPVVLESAHKSPAGYYYPWTLSTADDQNNAIANIAQLKLVFGLFIYIDSDGDGLPDWIEYVIWGDLTSEDGTGDEDEDGLTNSEEVAAGTEILVPDTDGDGLLDGEEIVMGTDPLNIDSDGDLVIDSGDAAPLDPAINWWISAVQGYAVFETDVAATGTIKGVNQNGQILLKFGNTLRLWDPSSGQPSTLPSTHSYQAPGTSQVDEYQVLATSAFLADDGAVLARLSAFLQPDRVASWSLESPSWQDISPLEGDFAFPGFGAGDYALVTYEHLGQWAVWQLRHNGSGAWTKTEEWEWDPGDEYPVFTNRLGEVLLRDETIAGDLGSIDTFFDVINIEPYQLQGNGLLLAPDEFTRMPWTPLLDDTLAQPLASLALGHGELWGQTMPDWLARSVGDYDASAGMSSLGQLLRVASIWQNSEWTDLDELVPSVWNVSEQNPIRMADDGKMAAVASKSGEDAEFVLLVPIEFEIIHEELDPVSNEPQNPGRSSVYRDEIVELRLRIDTVKDQDWELDLAVQPESMRTQFLPTRGDVQMFDFGIVENGNVTPEASSVVLSNAEDGEIALKGVFNKEGSLRIEFVSADGSIGFTTPDIEVVKRIRKYGNLPTNPNHDLDQHDRSFVDAAFHWKSVYRHEIDDVERLKAMGMVESSLGIDDATDIMTIGNPGDNVLNTFRNVPPFDKLPPQGSALREVDISNNSTRMLSYPAADDTPASVAIHYGTCWLYQKASSIAVNGSPPPPYVPGPWRSWDDATERYNGGGVADYLNRVHRVMLQGREPVANNFFLWPILSNDQARDN